MIAVVGLGNIGSRIASELSKTNEVVAVDADKERVERADAAFKVAGTVEDASDRIKESEVIVAALPGQAAYKTVKKILSWGKKVVDISYTPENSYNLESIAKKTGALYIPDCGFAPGLSNIFAYRIHRLFSAEDVEIIVGGLPREPVEPFLHSITWSAEGLIDEYTRAATVIQDYSTKVVDPFSSIGTLELSGFGEFEYFTSDGLRTLLSTMHIKNLSEKTLRIKGHIDRMIFLREMGFFSEKPIDRISPRKLTEGVFNKFRAGDDFCILLVRSGDKKKEILLTAEGTETTSAMSTLTALPAVTVARLVHDGRIDAEGILPPELIAENNDNYTAILHDLKAAGAKVVTNF